MNSELSAPGGLQFDTAILPHDAAPALSPCARVVCGACRQPVVTEYYDVNTIPVCAACRDQMAEQLAIPTGVGVMVRSLLFGLGAAIAGAILYYAVVVITNFEIGLVAIATGYMVGYAIQRATIGRGARRLQVLAIVLTYWSVGLAYTSLAVRAGRSEAEANDSLSRTSAVGSVGDSEESDSTAAAPVRVFAVLLGLTFAMPVILVSGSLPGGAISALIIGIGMQQAWKMTGVPHVVITGPFPIAASPPPA